MYRILSTILPDNDSIEIRIVNNDIVEFKKILHLDLYGDRTPSFSVNLFPYVKEDFNIFIKCIEKNENAIFAFENLDSDPYSCDGISYADNILIFTVAYGSNVSSFFLPINDENRNIIVCDFRTLSSLIDELIKCTNETLDRLEYIVEEIDENIIAK